MSALRTAKWRCLALVLTCCGCQQQAASPLPPSARPTAANDAALDLFQRRILPLLQARRPSSCAECHLSGVDLLAYIRPEQAETFAALRQAGLIDMDQPRKSKLLAFIRRRPERPSPVPEQARQEELAAFESWIVAAVKDPALLTALPAAAIGPQLPPEVVRHARSDRVLASFVEHVWSEVGRCAACHSPDRNQQQVREHGPRVSWIQLEDPAATLALLVEQGLIDTSAPAESLLLAKPTMQVDHGGGQKLSIGDRTYQQFRRFLEDYAASAAGTYLTAADLPPLTEELSAVTDIWLKLENIPAAFGNAVLQADIYAQQGDGWTANRVATAERPIAGDRGLWQQHISLTAPRDAPQARQRLDHGALTAGRYLLRIYIDRENKLETQYPYRLGAAELAAEMEIETAWPAGYGAMTVAPYPP